MGFLLSVAALMVSSLWQFRLWLQNKRKDRADAYNLELIHLIERIDRVNDPGELEQIHCHLFEIFAKVVRDLHRDRTTSESFQTFRFPWEITLSSARHRETVLRDFRPIQEIPDGKDGHSLADADDRSSSRFLP